jgi:hypothetical protein
MGPSAGIVSACPRVSLVSLCYTPLRTAAPFLVPDFSQIDLLYGFEPCATSLPADDFDCRLEIPMWRRSSAHDYRQR